jgi:hypothetical protein
LHARRSGYISVIVLVALVGGLAMASLIGARRTESSYPQFLASTNPSDLLVNPNNAPDNVSSFIAATGRLAHVRKVETAYQYSALALTPSGGAGTVLITGAEFVASRDGLFSDMDRVTVVQGRLFDPASLNQIVISPTAATLLHLHVGSHVSIGLDAANTSTLFPLAKRLDLTVAGVVVFNHQVVQDDIDKNRTGFLLGTPALARSLGTSELEGIYSGIQLVGGARYDTAVAGEYAHLAAAHPETGGANAYIASVIETEAQRAIRPEAIALGVFGVIAALAVILIAVQIISRQLYTNADETDVLRSLGAGPLVTTTDGLLGIIAAVVSGGLLAGATAIGLSPLTLFGPVRVVDPSPGVALDWTILGLGVLAVVLILGGAAALIARRLAPHRRSARPRTAERGSAVVRLAMSAGLPVPGVMGLRHALEPGRGRSAVPVRPAIVGTILALVVLTATLTFGASLDSLVSHPSLYGWNFSHALFSIDGYGPVPAEPADQLLSRDRSVAATTGVYFVTPEINGQTIPGLAERAGSPIGPPILSGHGLAGRDQIVLGTATLAELHEHIGGTVEVRGDGVEAVRLRIVGTATFPTIGDTFAEHASMGTGALFSTAVLGSSVLDNAGPYSGPNAIFIRLRQGVEPATGRASLEAIDRRLVALAHSRQVVSLIGTGEAAVFTIALLPAQRPAEIVNYRSMGTTPVVLALGLGLGTLVALGMTLVTSVRRRRYDLALLKTFGFTRGELFSSVIWQASTISVIGIVIGVPLGIVFGRSLWILFAHELSAVPQPTIPIGSIALAAAAAVVLANLVAAIPGQIAARSPVASVLAAD